jgi:hypothetical protein
MNVLVRIVRSFIDEIIVPSTAVINFDRITGSLSPTSLTASNHRWVAQGSPASERGLNLGNRSAIVTGHNALFRVTTNRTESQCLRTFASVFRSLAAEHTPLDTDSCILLTRTQQDPTADHVAPPPLQILGNSGGTAF